jgi:hypothetical protein
MGGYGSTSLRQLDVIGQVDATISEEYIAFIFRVLVKNLMSMHTIQLSPILYMKPKLNLFKCLS